MASTKTIKVPIKQVIFDPAKYPRQKPDQILIGMLQAALDTGKVPPIEISQNNYLIDGFHRVQAHQLSSIESIDAKVTECDDNDVLWLATERNSSHGKQLSREEKRALAKRFYKDGRDIPDIQAKLSVGKSQLYDWLREEIDKKNEAQQAEVLNLYLRCYTEDEIAEKIGVTQPSIHQAIIRFSENGKTYNRPESIQDYNLWEFATVADDMGEDGYPGRMAGQIVENLLWYYTDPFDLVVDPMAGGATTLDVCLAMQRRCICFDINPSARPHDIHQHDITLGLPSLPKLRSNGQVVRPRLLVLDPPYWKQKKGQYSQDTTNLANLDLGSFHDHVSSIIGQAHDYIAPNGYVAFIIGPTRSAGVVYDHMAAIINALDFKKWHITERIIAAYTTQQALATHLVQAREGKYMLRRYRDLLILQPK